MKDGSGKFFDIVDKISVLLLLGVVWILTSLPMITIGTSTTALYDTCLKYIHNETGKPFSYYFQIWKENSKNGIIGTTVYLLLMMMILYPMRRGIHPAALVVILILVLSAIYFFALMARFRLTIKEYFQTAMYMTVGHFTTSILLLITLILCCAAVILIPIGLPVVVPLYCLYASYFLEKVFRKYYTAQS